jgi:hypothetical protein
LTAVTFGILAQDLGCEIDRGLGNGGFEAGFGAAGGIGDSDHGHGGSPLSDGANVGLGLSLRNVIDHDINDNDAK